MRGLSENDTALWAGGRLGSHLSADLQTRLFAGTLRESGLGIRLDSLVQRSSN